MAQRIDLRKIYGHSLIEVLVALCLLSVMGLGFGLSALESVRKTRSNQMLSLDFDKEILSCEIDSVKYAPFNVPAIEPAA